MKALGLRWTIGDVSDFGFEALRLSLWGACKVFGPSVPMAVTVNTLAPAEAREKAGEAPRGVDWLPSGQSPASLAEFLDDAMAEGVAWKLAPPRVFPDIYELSLDNDCILWNLPDAVAAWLEEEEPRCLIAADVKPAFGAFAEFTRPEPRNTGIRGLPPHHDLLRALLRILQQQPVQLRSELDEQGLQAAALDLDNPAHIVSTHDVSICSPFWPHQFDLGKAGAHFVGLNSRALPWSYDDRPASEWIAEHWRMHFPELCRKVDFPASRANG